MQRVPFKISPGRKELLCPYKDEVEYKSCRKWQNYDLLKNSDRGKADCSYILQKLTSFSRIGYQLNSLGGGEWIFYWQLSRILAVGDKTLLSFHQIHIDVQR